MPLPEGPVEISIEGDVVPVTLKRKDSPDRKCELREMMGDKRDEFLDQNRKFVDANGNIRAFKDAQARLISYHLYDLDTKALVPIDEIRVLPAKVQTQLFEICVELSGLTKAAEQDAKNG